MISMRARTLACVTAAAALCDRLLPKPARAAPDDHVALQLLAVNDLHGALSTGRTHDGRAIGGAAYLAAHLARLRAERPAATLVVHTGDMVSASPVVSALLQDEPAVALMNQIGFDVGVVGNHEFDEGIEELVRLLTGGSHAATEALSGRFPGTRFPTLAANVLTDNGEPLLPPYLIRTLQDVRVGFIGVCTTETPRAVGTGTRGLRFLDEAETVNRYARELKADGVEVVVVLAHLGGAARAVGGPVSGPIVAFAHAVDDDVDVILSGHTHQAYAATIAGKLVVQARPYALALAAVELTVDRAARRVIAKTARIVPTWNDTVEPDPAVTAMVAQVEAYAAPIVNQVVGRAAAPITRDHDRTGEQALGNLIADAYRWSTEADVAVAHSGWNWADIAAGDVAWGDLFLVQPANRDLITISLTGDQLHRLLEEQWAPDRTTSLHLSGLIYEFAPERPPGERVANPRLADGRRLDPTARYDVTLDAYLAGGGGGFATPLTGTNHRIGAKDLDTLVRYVRHLPQPFHADIGGRVSSLPELASAPAVAPARPRSLVAS